MKTSIRKSYLFFVFLILFAFSTDFSNAQNFYFGFRDGINFTSTKQSNNSYMDFNPASIYCLIGTNVYRDFKMELRAGYMFGITNNYTGPEWGFYLRPDIITNKVYFLFGINVHVNLPDNPSNISRTIVLPGIGIGYNFHKALTAELIYYYPLRNDYVSFSPPGNEPTLTNIIQLSLGINISKLE